MGDDNVPAEFCEKDRWGGEVMKRLGDGWCAALDRRTLMCTIYARRPGVCREYPVAKTCGYFDFLLFERDQQEDKKFVATTNS